MHVVMLSKFLLCLELDHTHLLLTYKDPVVHVLPELCDQLDKDPVVHETFARP